MLLKQHMVQVLEQAPAVLSAGTIPTPSMIRTGQAGCSSADHDNSSYPHLPVFFGKYDCR
jgi:hypothetical protein